MVMRVFGLAESAYTSWSYAEDAVSYDRQDASGGITQWTVSGVSPTADQVKLKQPLKLVHSAFGQTAGQMSALSFGPSSWTVTADSAFHRLNVELTMIPLSNVEAKEVVKTYLSACDPKMVFTGEDAVDIFQHPSLNGKRFNVAGFTGNVWGNLKSWCSANDLNIAWIHDIIAIYPNRTQSININGFNSDWSINYSEEEKARTVSCYVYHKSATNERAEFAYIYPHRNSVHQTDHTESGDMVITVDAGQTVVTDIAVNADLTRVLQPIHVYQINNTNPTANLSGYQVGVYAVVGADNKPITPEQWSAEGGSLTVEVHPENSRSIRVTVTGMNNTRLGPYRIAESDGSKDYPALYVVGSGHIIETELVTLDTGYDGRGEGVTIDNPNIDTLSKAYDAMAYAATSGLGFRQTLDWTGVDPIKETFTDFAVGLTPEQPTLGTVQKVTGVPLPAKATAKWPNGTTMRKIMDDLRLEKTSELTQRGARQTFGRVAGARGWFQGRMWRVNSAEFSDESLNISAELDIRLGDYMSITGNSPRDTDISGGPTLLDLTLRSYERK